MVILGEITRFPLLHNESQGLAIRYWFRLCYGTSNVLLNIALWRTAPGDTVLERLIENLCGKKFRRPRDATCTKQVVSLWANRVPCIHPHPPLPHPHPPTHPTHTHNPHPHTHSQPTPPMILRQWYHYVQGTNFGHFASKSEISNISEITSCRISILGFKPIFTWSRNQINTLSSMEDHYYLCVRTKNMKKSQMAANFALYFVVSVKPISKIQNMTCSHF